MGESGRFVPLPVGRIAVALAEFERYGCPSCGYLLGYAPISGGGSSVWSCGSCGKGCIILEDGQARSSIGVGSNGGETVYPELQPHPRRGMPGHKDRAPGPSGG
jgi:hypothetical protein